MLRCTCKGECVQDEDGERIPYAKHCACCLGKCDCLPAAYQPPCRHVLALSARLSLEEMAALLLGLRPGEYREPRPPCAAGALPPGDDAHLAAVDEYDLRQTLGWGLWRKDDPWRKVQATIPIDRGRRRGVVLELPGGGLDDGSEPDEDDDELCDEVRADLAARAGRRRPCLAR